jgi:hypothetical protein
MPKIRSAFYTDNCDLSEDDEVVLKSLAVFENSIVEAVYINSFFRFHYLLMKEKDLRLYVNAACLIPPKMTANTIVILTLQQGFLRY